MISIDALFGLPRKSLLDKVLEIHFMARYSSKISLQLMSMLLVHLKEVLVTRFSYINVHCLMVSNLTNRRVMTF